MPVLLDEPLYKVVALEDDLLEVSLAGSGDEAEVEEFFGKFLGEVRARAPIRLMTDVSNLRDLSPKARWKLARRMKENRLLFAKSVVFGLSTRNRVVLSILLRASGRSDILVANSREQAVLLVRSDSRS